MSIYVGIDAGGSKTACHIYRDNLLISTSITGSGNIYANGIESAFNNIVNSYTTSCEKAQLKDVDSIHIGGASLGKDENRELLISEFKKVSNAIITASDDSILPLYALNNGYGISLISGTGSIAVSRSNKGDVIRSGGFGSLLGDEGSAYYTSKEAFRRALYSSELIDKETLLIDKIKEFYSFKSLSDVIYFVNDRDTERKEIAKFSTVVDSLYNIDEVSHEIIDMCAYSLFALIQSLILRSTCLDKTIVLSGGFILKNENINRKLKAIIEVSLKEYRVLEADSDSAVIGAAMIAKESIKKNRHLM